MRKNMKNGLRFLLPAVLLAAAGMTGCGTKDVRNEAVASANGETIQVIELREFLGFRGGRVAASEVPVEQKKEALNRLIAGRLLAQDARARGLDNTDEFRSLVARNEQAVLITALFRKEIAAKANVSREDIQAEVKRMRASDNSLSEEDARAKANRSVPEEKIRKVEEELIAAARKEFPAVVRQEEMDRIARGEKLPEDTVLATAAGDNVTYGELKRSMDELGGGMHGGRDLASNPVAIARILEREVTGRSLAALAAKQGIPGSEWMKTARQDMERSVLIELLAEREVMSRAEVGDREVRKAYEDHGEMFMREGKKIPYPQVREQIRDFLLIEQKRKVLEAYIDDLKAKAKITVNEAMLGKV